MSNYFNLWKHFLNYGNPKSKIDAYCREYVEYTPLLKNAKELSIEPIKNGLLELKGFSHLIQKINIEENLSQENKEQNSNVRRRK